MLGPMFANAFANASAALDALLDAADGALRTLSGGAHASRPAPEAAESQLAPAERRLSGALMRVNHVGEVCAQADRPS